MGHELVGWGALGALNLGDIIRCGLEQIGQLNLG